MKKIVSLLLALLFIGLYGCGESAAQASLMDSQQSSSAIDEEEESSSLEDASSAENNEDDTSSPESAEEDSSSPTNGAVGEPGDLGDDYGRNEYVKLDCDIQMRTYDIKNVTCTVSYGGWEKWESHSYRDWNDVQDIGCILYISNSDLSYHCDEEAQIIENYLLEAVCYGVTPPIEAMQIKNFFTRAEAQENYSFYYDDKGEAVYSHTESITIPAELFTQETGFIYITFAFYGISEYEEKELWLSFQECYGIRYEKQGEEIMLTRASYISYWW